MNSRGTVASLFMTFTTFVSIAVEQASAQEMLSLCMYCDPCCFIEDNCNNFYRGIIFCHIQYHLDGMDEGLENWFWISKSLECASIRTCPCEQGTLSFMAHFTEMWTDTSHIQALCLSQLHCQRWRSMLLLHAVAVCSLCLYLLWYWWWYVIYHEDNIHKKI